MWSSFWRISHKHPTAGTFQCEQKHSEERSAACVRIILPETAGRSRCWVRRRVPPLYPSSSISTQPAHGRCRWKNHGCGIQCKIRFQCTGRQQYRLVQKTNGKYAPVCSDHQLPIISTIDRKIKNQARRKRFEAWFFYLYGSALRNTAVQVLRSFSAR